MKNSALKKEQDTSKPGALRVEKANEVVVTTVPGELDKLIHERLRLGMISALAANASLSFNELKKLLQTTDGNISVHARKLEDAGYIQCTKTFKDRMPLTEYKITAAGKKALEKYIGHMEALIKAMKGGSKR
ncbi:MAG TPA: transcriptional regulator [Pyrinomonadaceae bacterium]|jgi:DNA-binding MarR family transcriptional regulator|nr:transcriptional regulator [Pyrinomonadaceae bacterium]